MLEIIVIQKFIKIVEDVKSFVPLLGINEHLLIELIRSKRQYTYDEIIQSISFLESQGEISKSDCTYFLEKI